MLLKEWENDSSRSVYPLSKNHPLSGTARAASEEVYLSHIEKSKSSTSGQKEDRGWEAVSLAFKDSTFGCWSAKLLQRAPPLSFGEMCGSRWFWLLEGSCVHLLQLPLPEVGSAAWVLSALIGSLWPWTPADLIAEGLGSVWVTACLPASCRPFVGLYKLLTTGRKKWLDRRWCQDRAAERRG